MAGKDEGRSSIPGTSAEQDAIRRSKKAKRRKHSAQRTGATGAPVYQKSRGYRGGKKYTTVSTAPASAVAAMHRVASAH